MQMRLIQVFCVTCFFGSFLAAKYCDFDDVASMATTMTCTNMTSEMDLDDALRANKHFNISRLVIKNSSFRFMIQGGFQDTYFKNIYIENCSILGLTDGEVAFQGLEDHLEILQVQYTSLTSHWNWHQLRNLKKLKAVKIWDCELDYISREMGDLSKDTLLQIEVVGSGATTIHGRAFSDLYKVRQFFLDDNKIEVVRRSIYPDPGDEIVVIGLSYNKLQNLPSNMFDEMPNLMTINLSGNLLRTIGERIFIQVWSNLTIFNMNDTPLHCDCRLGWIPKQPSHPQNTYAVCNSPERLKGVSIKDLKSQDLWC